MDEFYTGIAHLEHDTGRALRCRVRLAVRVSLAGHQPHERSESYLAAIPASGAGAQATSSPSMTGCGLYDKRYRGPILA